MHPFNHHFPAFTALPSGVGLVRVIVVVELFVRPHAVVLIIVLCGFGGQRGGYCGLVLHRNVMQTDRRMRERDAFLDVYGF